MTKIIKNDEELAQFLASPRRILFVEDDPGVRDSLAAISRSYRCVWDEAPTGEEALELLQKHQYSLVLLDLHLPGISGLEVFKAISDSPQDTPVCIITGRPIGEEAIHDFYQIGWCTFARKPQDFNARFFRQLFGTFGIQLRNENAAAPAPGPINPPSAESAS